MQTFKGFSLFELIMTLALAALIFGLGIPSFSKLIANNRIRAEINGFFHAIHLARKESITRNRVVTICPSVNGQHCTDRSAWSAGWIVFVNNDRDLPAVRDPDEAILHHYKVHPQIKIEANRDSFSLRTTRLRATNGTFIVCDKNAIGTSRSVVVSYTGRPRVAYENRRGQPYECAG